MRVSGVDPVFRALLRKPGFRWERDGEALLRARKKAFFDADPMPTVTVPSSVSVDRTSRPVRASGGSGTPGAVIPPSWPNGAVDAGRSQLIRLGSRAAAGARGVPVQVPLNSASWRSIAIRTSSRC